MHTLAIIGIVLAVVIGTPAVLFLLALAFCAKASADGENPFQ